MGFFFRNNGWSALLILLSSGFNSICFAAEEIVFSEANDRLPIGQYLSYYNDRSGQEDSETIWSKFKAYPERIMDSDAQVPNFGLLKGNLWLSFSVTNQTHQSLYLSIQNPHIDYAKLYQITESGAIKPIGSAGDAIPYFDWQIKDRNLLFDLSKGLTEPQVKRQYLLKINKSGSLRLPITLVSANHLLENNNDINLFLGIYFGFYILIFIISCAIFVAYRDAVFAYYSLFILSFSNLLFLEFGFGYQYLWSDLGFDVSPLRVIFGVFNCAALTLFACEFLKLKQHFPKLRRYAFYWLCLLLIQTLPSVFVVPKSGYIYVVPWYFGGLLISALLLITITLKSLKFQRRESLYLLASFGALIAGATIVVALELKVVPYNVITGYAFVWFPLLDILILSLGLAFKVNEMYQTKLQWSAQLIEHQKQMISAMISGEERERKRLSRELHDGISGNLISLNLKINADAAKADIAELSNQTLLEVRNISHKLLPPEFDSLSIEQIIQNYLDSIKQELPFDIQFMVSGPVNDLRQLLKITLYRIIQECVSNALKYAQASTLIIQLLNYGEEITLMVEDNGVGFDVDKASTGIGLLNIQSRVSELKGRFSIEASEKIGTSIIIALPIEA